MNPGERITWKAVNGPQSGIIQKKHCEGYLVLLYSGKYVIVHEKSIIK